MKKRVLPIHWKFTIGFIFIFSIAAFCLYAYVSHVLNVQTHASIRDDMKKLQAFTYDHIGQEALLLQVKGGSRRASISSLLTGISRSTGHPAAYYDKEGNFTGETILTSSGGVLLSPKPSSVAAFAQQIDWRQTMEDKSIVTLLQDEGKHVVLLTLPYYINDVYEGMIRLSSEYTSRYQHNDAILASFAWFALFLFAVVTIFTYILSKRMTRPLVALSSAMKGFGEGKLAETALPAERDDEVGRLSASFQQMKTQIEEQLAHLAAERNRVVELEKSRTKFYQHITHELKTPLTSISGYAQIIGQPKFDDPEFLERAAMKIKQESDRLHGMVVQVLELARREEDAGNREPMETIDLRDQLEACCEDMELKASRYTMQLQSDFEKISVSGRKDELRKVWVNLLDNAIKYGDAGTVIQVQVKVSQEPERVVVVVANEREHQLDADEMLVFEPFYRENTVGDTGSIGLGLTICRSIVENHGGTIAFRQQGRQVLVEVELPIRQ